jgi:hypothetical protein
MLVASKTDSNVRCQALPFSTDFGITVFFWPYATGRDGVRSEGGGLLFQAISKLLSIPPSTL